MPLQCSLKQITVRQLCTNLSCLFHFIVMYFLYCCLSLSLSAANQDPDIAAAAAAVLEEEEERERQEQWEKTQRVLAEEELKLQIDDPTYRRPRNSSLGNISAPPLYRSSRLASLAGTSSGPSTTSLLKPQRRYSTAFLPSPRSEQRLLDRRRSTMVGSPRNISAYRRGIDSFKRENDFITESDGEEADDEFEQITVHADINHQNASQSFLCVPKVSITVHSPTAQSPIDNINDSCRLFQGQESRRSSGLTCCSTESSFLERRCSGLSLGISSLPSVSRDPSRRPSFRDDFDLEKGNTVNHQQHHLAATPVAPSQPATHSSLLPTFLQPSVTPCLIERRHIERRATTDENDFDFICEYPEQQQQQSHQHQVIVTATVLGEGKRPTTAVTTTTTTAAPVDLRGRAPLASLSSFRLSSTECQDESAKSIGSDTVFGDDYSADTEDEMDQLSTDSDEVTKQQLHHQQKLVKSPPKSILKNARPKVEGIELQQTQLPCSCDHYVSQPGSSGSGNVIVSSSDSKVLGVSHTNNNNKVNSNNVTTTTQQKQQQQKSSKKTKLLTSLKRTFETKAIIERHDNYRAGSDPPTSVASTTVELRTRSSSVPHVDIECQRPLCTDSSSDSEPDNTGYRVKLEAQRILTARLVDAAAAGRENKPVVVIEMPALSAQTEPNSEVQLDNSNNSTHASVTIASEVIKAESPPKWSQETLF